jgi:iron complex transport system substrate-binding protein
LQRGTVETIPFEPGPWPVRRRRRGGASALLIAFAVHALCANSAQAQARFTDDAKRNVTLPAHVSRVFAAGAPAEVLLYTLVPDMLVGRNHVPTAAALEFMPPELRSPRPIKKLPDRDDPRYDDELIALRPDVYIDYGTIDDDYIGALDAIASRTKVPAIILDGDLANIPATYRKLGTALGAPERAERLAAEAQRLIDKYRNAAASVRVYLACSRDSLMPCVQGHPFGEAAELLGAVNTAGTTATAPKRPFTVQEVRLSKPDAIVAASQLSADIMRNDPEWHEVDAVAKGRVYFPPEQPFSWGPRPPSVNRLLGVIWLAYALRARPFDDAFFADVTSAFETFYHFSPTREQIGKLVADPRRPGG